MLTCWLTNRNFDAATDHVLTLHTIVTWLTTVTVYCLGTDPADDGGADGDAGLVVRDDLVAAVERVLQVRRLVGQRDGEATQLDVQSTCHLSGEY